MASSRRLGKKKIQWSTACNIAFSEVKRSLSDAVLLHHPNPFSSTSLTVDAFEVAIGAELSQRGPDHSWKPLAFFSHVLTPAETKYSAFDRELLAMYLSVKHLKQFLEGKLFSIYIDHKLLTHALTSPTDNRSPRQTRHLCYVAEFTSDVRYIKGEPNIVADALSRPSSKKILPPAVSSVASVSFPEVPGVDFKAMALAQDPGSLLETSSLELRRLCLLYTSPSPRD